MSAEYKAIDAMTDEIAAGRTFKADYAFGKASENSILNQLNLFFKDNIKLSEDKYSAYDYAGDKYIYELKSRTNKYADFPTSLLPINKVFTNNQVFLFKFTDGLYYIYYEKSLFDTFECQMFARNRRMDYSDKPQNYYFIPIRHLKKINY